MNSFNHILQMYLEFDWLKIIFRKYIFILIFFLFLQSIFEPYSEIGFCN